MTSKTKVRGTITYDDYFGHVCTCTATREQEERTVYENTVKVDRDSGTETGSYWYFCLRCGAGAWSGL